MIITLLGMSNSGKTYWSQRLTSAGYTHYCCDEEIEKKLEVPGMTPSVLAREIAKEYGFSRKKVYEKIAFYYCLLDRFARIVFLQLRCGAMN